MQRIQPPISYNFSVSFANANGKTSTDTYFSEVSGIGAEITYDEVREGGQHDTIYYLPGNIVYSNLVFKRGLATFGSEILQWCFDTLSSKNNIVEPKNIVVSLLDADQKSYMTWNFFEAFPVKWQVGEFNAQVSGIAIEIIEVRYNKMTYNQ